MGILNDLGINGEMDRNQIGEQLFAVRKKLVSRQNSADAKKRAAAETQLDALSSLQNAIDKAAGNFPDIQLLVQTYGFLADNGKLNKDNKASLENAAAGNGEAAGILAEFLGKNGQDKLRSQWVFWAGECGAAGAYQVCGYLLTDSDPDNAIKWFEKAQQANILGAANIYNWGLIYYRKKMYAQAKQKFETASAQGHSMAPFFLGEMYENGYGVPKNLQTALQQYQLAGQRGFQTAQQGIERVSDMLKLQGSQQNGSGTRSGQGNAQGQTRQKAAQPDDQTKLVYKSDRKSAIPNLDDIHIDDLKEKVNYDQIRDKVEQFAGNVEGLAGNVDADKIKGLPWKKILIGVILFFVIMSVFKKCASAAYMPGTAEAGLCNAAVESVTEEDTRPDLFGQDPADRQTMESGVTVHCVFTASASDTFPR